MSSDEPDKLRVRVAHMVVASRIVRSPSDEDYETADRIIAEVRQSMMPTFPGETDDELPPLRRQDASDE